MKNEGSRKGHVVPFPKKRRNKLRPNRRGGRSPAELRIFPVTVSAADFLFDASLNVAAGAVDVTEVLRQIYKTKYWMLPKAVVQKEFSRAGWRVYHRANGTRRYCGLPDLEPPARSRGPMTPGLPPAA